MLGIYKLKNTVQEYTWGSRTAIPELLGEKSPSEKPQAELWMGAHPKAPSQINVEGSFVSLNYFIKRHPEGILGEKVARKFNNQLPFLFKVIAAAKPLSIQAHPNRQQAIEGFERENALGISIDAPNRNYRDNNHKPEIICALTNFWALNGFRKISEIIEMSDMLEVGELKHEIDLLRNNPTNSGLKAFFESLMTMEDTRRKSLIKNAVEASSSLLGENVVFQWICKLHDEYPMDVAFLAPLYLNLIELKPREAMFLEAGDLHAYLDGVGIELMANSDNVLRGGLTPKHVDVPELLRIVNFNEKTLNILKPVELKHPEKFYLTEADEFELSIIETTLKDTYDCGKNEVVQILLVIEGEALITDKKNGNIYEVRKGESVLIPATVDYRIRGKAIIFKASVPTNKL